jgi:hypothetical protein
MAGGQTMIYLVQFGGLIKVGVTDSWRERLKNLRRQYGPELTVIAVYEDLTDIHEREIKWRMRAVQDSSQWFNQNQTEWFNISPKEAKKAVKLVAAFSSAELQAAREWRYWEQRIIKAAQKKQP